MYEVPIKVYRLGGHTVGNLIEILTVSALCNDTQSNQQIRERASLLRLAGKSDDRDVVQPLK